MGKLVALGGSVAVALAVGAGCTSDGAATSGDAASGDAAPPDPWDAGPPPAWTGAPAVACDDAPGAVYEVAAPGVGAAGAILACADDGVHAIEAVASQLEGAGAGEVEATTGVALHRVAYVTARRDGTPVVSAARVYLPATPRATPVPLVVVAHPSVGIADGCAPSDDAAAMRDLALPFAARGFAVIAPDFAGLGNDGVQAYLDNREQGRQLLDGARALRAVVGDGLAAGATLVVGYSQGGGAALSAQALEAELGAGDGDGDAHLAGVIGFAPQWPIDLDSFDYLALLRDPDRLTILTGLSYPAIAVLRQYAWFEAEYGAGHGVDAFPAADRDGVGDAIESLCLIELGGWIQANLTTTGDLVDGALRAGVLACVDAGGDAAGCTGPARAWWEFQGDNTLSGDPDGAPILIFQGLADQILPAAGEAACIAAHLRAGGVAPQICSSGGDTHATVLGARIGDAVAWGEARLLGDAPPAFACEDALPACSP